MSERTGQPGDLLAPGDGTQATAPRLLSSETLLAGADEILIQHEGETYRLRRTRQGKLILTK